MALGSGAVSYPSAVGGSHPLSERNRERTDNWHSHDTDLSRSAADQYTYHKHTSHYIICLYIYIICLYYTILHVYIYITRILYSCIYVIISFCICTVLQACVYCVCGEFFTHDNTNDVRIASKWRRLSFEEGIQNLFIQNAVSAIGGPTTEVLHIFGRLCCFISHSGFNSKINNMWLVNYTQG